MRLEGARRHFAGCPSAAGGAGSGAALFSRVSLARVASHSRSGLERALIGNTAEQLLRFLPCDLLILKPPEFVCRVPAAQRGAQQISAPPLS